MKGLSSYYWPFASSSGHDVTFWTTDRAIPSHPSGAVGEPGGFRLGDACSTCFYNPAIYFTLFKKTAGQISQCINDTGKCGTSFTDFWKTGKKLLNF